MNFIKHKPFESLVILLGFLFFGVLMFMAINLFAERMLCLDAAFYSFKLSFYHDFNIEHGRWPSVFTQIPALIGLKNACSLETFLKLYSLGFVICDFLVFLLIVFVLKNYQAALILLMTLCIAHLHSWYISIAELYQGFALCILFFAILSRMPYYSRKIHLYSAFASACITLFIAASCHIMILFPLLFIIIHEVILNKRYKDKFIWSVSGFMLLCYIYLLFIKPHDQYESDRIPTIAMILRYIPHFWSLWSFQNLYNFVIGRMTILWILFFSTFFLALVRRLWLYAAFLFLFPFGFIVLVCIYCNYPTPEDIFLRQYFAITGIFISIAFVSLYYRTINKYLLILAVGIIVFARLKAIYDSHNYFTKHLRYIDRMAYNAKGLNANKIIIDFQNMPLELHAADWTFSFESILETSIHTPAHPVVMFIHNDFLKYEPLLNDKNLFLGPYFWLTMFPGKNLGPCYHLAPGYYIKVNNLYNDSFADKHTKNYFTLQPIDNLVYAPKDTKRKMAIEYKIENKSGHCLNSIPVNGHGVFFGYHIYNEKGELLNSNSTPVYFEMDIDKLSIQAISVEYPWRKGIYFIDADFVSDGVKWWGINSRCKLIVE